MNEIQLAVGVVALFVARIGLPMLILIVIGILIDRLQSIREQDTEHRIRKSS